MQKFTIFTFILTVIVVVVVAEMFVNDYLPGLKDVPGQAGVMELDLPEGLDISDGGQANVLGADIDYSKIAGSELVYEEVALDDVLPEPTEIETVELNEPSSLPLYPTPTSSSDIPDFEDDNFVSFSQNVLLRDDQIKSAGFVGAYLEQEPHDGFLFKSIYIDDLYDVEVTKNVIKSNDALFAKVYVFQVGPLSSLHEVYEVLRVRGSEGLDVEVNETNDFGDGSFFMNDSRRSNVAFLTVKIGASIYGFSYPKEYHSQIKNLITLLDLEF